MTSETKTARRATGEGYVYVAATEAHPGLLKIGFTRQDPRKRIQQFSTGSPHPFQILDLFKVADPEGLEKALHRRFAEQRVNEGREFFAVSLSNVKLAVRMFAEEVRYREDLETAQEQLDKATVWRIRDGAWRKWPIWAQLKTTFDRRWIKWLTFIVVAQAMGLLNHLMFNDGEWSKLGGYLDGWRFLYYPIIPLSWLVALCGLLLVAIPSGVIFVALIEMIDSKKNRPELEALRQRLAQEMRLKVSDLKI